MSLAIQKLGPDAPPMTIGTFLKNQRVLKGLTQRELSEQTGINLSSIKQYERDGAPPTIEKAALLAKVLGFDLNDFGQEVLEPGSTAIGASDLPDDSERSSKADAQSEDGAMARARDLLERIQKLATSRGVTARYLATLATEAEGPLSELTPDELHELADDIGMAKIVDRLWPDIEGRNDLPTDAVGEYCDSLQAGLIVFALYGQRYFDLTFSEARDLHRVVAQATGSDWPLAKVPTRSFLGDIFSDDDENAKLRSDVLVNMSSHVVEAFKRSRPIVLEWSDDDEQHFSEPGRGRNFEPRFSTK